MKKNIKDLTILILFTIILFGILINYNLIIENIKISTELWLFKLFPSLFPFLVIGSILINYNITEFLANIFKIKNNYFVIFILSLISGFPSNAKYTKEMYLKNYISLQNATNVLCFTFFSNPLFLLSILSLTFPLKITIAIILSHYLANLVIALFFKNKNKENNFFQNYSSLSLTNVLSNSIKDGINTMLLILGTITFYSIIICLVKIYLPNPLLNSILTGFLEFSQGLNSLITLNTNIILKAYMAVSFISFGSLSILTQIKSIIQDTPINFSKFVLFRLIHVGISFLILTIFLGLYNLFL